MIIKNMRHLFLLMLVLAAPCCIGALSLADQIIQDETLSNLKSRIHQYFLDNGLRVICIPAENTNKVSVGSFVQVGSSHEQPSEWGMAHIVEHMVFKGTKRLKEGDLDRLCNRFGMHIVRDYNAHTSLDHTAYYFYTDQENWQVFAEVVADSLQNLLVTPAALNSELQAISQEIKLGKRDQNTSKIFNDFLPQNHPSVHDVIGYKEEVLRYTAEDVMNFYYKHYTPAKSTFFVCGNVQPEDVLAFAKKAFAGFDRVGASPREVGAPIDLPFYPGFAQVNRVIYHTENKKEYSYSWNTVPSGSPDALALKYVANALSRRLEQKYVNELGYAFYAYAYVAEYQYAGLFCVGFCPRQQYYDFDFAAATKAEIDDIILNGLTKTEMEIITKAFLVELVYTAENPLNIPLGLARIAACSLDPVGQFFAKEEQLMTISTDTIRDVTYRYLRSFLMHKQEAVPLPLEEQSAWSALQQRVMAHEQRLLQARARTDLSAFEVSADTPAEIPDPVSLQLPADVDYKEFVLPNGLVVYWNKTAVSARCVCALVVKDADRFRVPLSIKKKQFAWDVACDMLLYGTDSYSEKEFKDLIDVNGLSISARSSYCWVVGLKSTIEEGLRLLRLALDKNKYDVEYLERKKQETIDGIFAEKNNLRYRFDDYVSQVFSLVLPWRFGEAAVIENLKSVTIDDVRSVISLLKDPAATALIITGDLTEKEVHRLAQQYFGDFSEPTSCSADSFDVPECALVVNDYIPLPVENAAIFAFRLGSTQGTTDTACLELLSNYFKKKVWDIRERTGLFYAGGCSYSSYTNRFSGMILLQAKTTPGNVAAVEAELRLVLESIFAPDNLNEQVFTQLKDEFEQSCGKYLTTAGTVASRATQALIENVAMNYDRLLVQQVAALTFEQFVEVIHRYGDPATWSFVTVGAGKTLVGVDLVHSEE